MSNKLKIKGLRWFDVREWGIEGKGFADTSCYYERLPRRAKSLLPELWPMSKDGVGFCCDFETNADHIGARWRMRLNQLDGANMSRAAFSGVDLYTAHSKTWRWAGVGFRHTDRVAEDILTEGMEPVRRRFRLYFPLRNPVLKMTIGVPHEAEFQPIAPRSGKPIVFYGSSIVHGAYASRPGLVHPAILGRKLGLPVINLGFSGVARMQEAMAHLLAELDAAAFVIDPLPNMDVELVNKNAERFLRILCNTKPQIPVLLVEDFPQTFAGLRPAMRDGYRQKWRAFEKLFCRLKDEGFASLHYVRNPRDFDGDTDATVDGIHPNERGYELLTNLLINPLRKRLGRNEQNIITPQVTKRHFAKYRSE
jgi:hypothetical protein